LAREPRRIISLAPSVTEMLFAIGLGDRLVGVTSFCDYPPEASKIEKVGDTLKPSLEKIAALRPDLVIISTSSQLEGLFGKLEELGIPVYVSNPRSLEGILSSIEKVGEVAGAAAKARSLTSEMRVRIQAVRARVAALTRPRVLIILSAQPLITAGGNTFVNDLISVAGGISISSDQKEDYPQYSLESALARRPEVIFLQAGREPLPERLKQTPAFAAGRVFHIDDALILRPGPRIVEGLEQMAAKLHPEAYR
jgi:iron complex transport system substrate-binding protein